jgi:hypothetical protein
MTRSFHTRARLNCEALERRELMAGNVTAKVLPTGLLQIIGDNQSNEIQIRPAGSARVEVTGYPQAGSPTKLNKQTSPLTFSVTNGIQVYMKGGNDDLLIKGNAGRTIYVPGLYGLIVDMGSDADLLDVSHVRVDGPCDLYGGNGMYADTINATFSQFHKYLHISVGDGNNFVDVLGCTVAGMVKVDAQGNGQDTFSLSEVKSTNDKVWVVMAGGDDKLSVDYIWSAVASTLDGGLGNGDKLHVGIFEAPRVNLHGWEGSL